MTEASASIRRMELGEEERVCCFVRRVFNDFVAPIFAKEGVEEFLRYIAPDLIA